MPEVNTEIPDVFILCGGQGTRFRAVRKDIPKALAPINGVSFLDLLLDNLISRDASGSSWVRVIWWTIDSRQQRSDAEYLISRGGAFWHQVRSAMRPLLNQTGC